MSLPDVPEHLRGIAEVAAHEFLKEECALELLGHGQSLTHRVDAPSGRYLLRVHSPRCPPANPAFFTARAIESECAWLRALSDEGQLVVQEPVPSPAGGHVLHVPRSGTGAPVPCTLLTWVDGEPLSGKRTTEQATRLGELLAALHEHARRWTRPAEFERPIHDRASWRLALARIDDLVEIGLAASADRVLLTRAVEQAELEMASLAHQPDRVGLIHADLHETNYVFHGDSLRPIDFSRAGFGPWLYDVAERLGHLGPERRRDLVEAYAQRRPLADGDLRRIEGYFVTALIECFGYHAPDPSEHPWLARAVPAWAPHIRRYVDGTPFLFDL